MSTRKLKDSEIRKVIKLGNSLAVTLPKAITNELKWREKQKLVVRKQGNKIIIEDWK